MLMTGHSSIPNLWALIEYDIAYFHLRKLKWKPKEAARLADDAGRADDDDAPPASPGVPSPQNHPKQEIDY
jgi:hypothetical protein